MFVLGTTIAVLVFTVSVAGMLVAAVGGMSGGRHYGAGYGQGSTGSVGSVGSVGNIICGVYVGVYLLHLIAVTCVLLPSLINLFPSSHRPSAPSSYGEPCG